MKKIKPLYKKLLIVTIGLIIILSGTLGYISWKNNTQEYIVKTQKVTKGEISNTITATGTLEATNTVVVGTQVSGVIKKLYVDFNAVVKKGQLIAELDKSTLQSTLETAEADLENAQAEYIYQQAKLSRKKDLLEKKVFSQSDYDLVNCNFKKSKAAVKSARANLNRATLNLNYATIYSPIDGIVLNRAVEEGQTVTASMNTPELFTITNDLKEMQVEADIDEADIGMIKETQRVEFTVDAFPDLNFEGEVAEIRLQPNESSNVITYTVIISVSNPDLKLKPGMTASIITYVEEANDILLIPSKVTRFMPKPELLFSYQKSLSGEKSTDKTDSIQNKKQHEPPLKRQKKLDDEHKIVWVKNGNEIHPVVIQIGIDDGTSYEVINGLKEGDVLIESLTLDGDSKLKNKPLKGDEQKSPFVQSGGQGGEKRSGPPR